MKKIKSFIYLDNYKMYSISSQLFEGLTEYVVKSEVNSHAEKDEQKGTLGSGRLMANIIESETGHSEKRFLHHYSYNLFENQLIQEDRVLEINSENIVEASGKLQDYNFIKITNRIGFNDTKIVDQTLGQFNDIGEALTYAIHNEDLNKYNKEVKDLVAPIKDRNQKHKAQNLANQGLNLRNLAKEAGMFLEPKLIESLRAILSYGFNKSFEIQLPFVTDDSYYLFSALLNRELLTEPEVSIITKYSRETEKEFTLFGIITQIKTVKEKISVYKDAVARMSSGETPNMKEAVMNIINSITIVESSLNGKLDYEYIIDPIAVYREI